MADQGTARKAAAGKPREVTARKPAAGKPREGTARAAAGTGPGRGRGPAAVPQDHTPESRPVGLGPEPGLGQPLDASARLLLFGTGALSVAFLPYWLNWLRIAHPDTEVRVAVTRSAERFVSRAALTAILGREVLLDAWPGTTPDGTAPHVDHVELAQWPDAVAVHPAGLNFIGRFAQGLADTPVLMALQCTRAVIGIAPALPPGAERNPAYRAHLQTLGRYDNVLIAPPHPGRSSSTGRNDASVAAPLSTLWDLITAHRTRPHLEESPHAGAA